jgi:hypothetical protein
MPPDADAWRAAANRWPRQCVYQENVHTPPRPGHWRPAYRAPEPVPVVIPPTAPPLDAVDPGVWQWIRRYLGTSPL